MKFISQSCRNLNTDVYTRVDFYGNGTRITCNKYEDGAGAGDEISRLTSGSLATFSSPHTHIIYFGPFQ